MKRWQAEVALLATLGISACSNIVGRVDGPPPPPTPPVKSTASVDVDLLLVVDDSASMADKQKYLAQAIPSLLSAIVDPPCVDGTGTFVSQPADRAEACPGQSSRSSQPVASINLGVITSSLGGVGSDACPDAPGSYNDARGHLVVRTTKPDPTYLGYGFLAFDPQAVRSPPGQGDFNAFTSDAVDLIQSVGERGCGYEMPLEAAYRFLVDPKPYASITKTSNDVYAATEPVGLDTDLIDQRAHFLRPNSILVVMFLSDENDCSVKAGGQWYAPLDSAPFYRSSSICATKPNDPCCYSCGEKPPPNCLTPDAACAGMPFYTAQEDDVNLKCFHTKERYGVSALYPVARYLNAFSKSTIVPTRDDLAGDGDRVDNPLFSKGRQASSVIITAIVGVPWQEIANDPSDPTEGMQNASALVADGAWDRIAGDPDGFRYPTAPAMQESVAKRPGVNPAENGGDRTLDTAAPVDLQYACTFKLAQPELQSPTCTSPDSPDNPVCDYGDGAQIAAKAYPALRELAVVGGLGEQGVVASICPFDPLDGTSSQYGLLPAMSATVQRLARALRP